MHIFRASSNSHTETPLNRTKYDIYYLEAKYLFSIVPYHKIMVLEDLLNLEERDNFYKILEDNKMKKFLKSFVNKIILNISDSNQINNTLKMRITNFSKNILHFSNI